MSRNFLATLKHFEGNNITGCFNHINDINAVNSFFLPRQMTRKSTISD